MTQQEFIEAIKAVDEKAAKLMTGYLASPHILDMSLDAINTRDDASHVLIGLFVWSKASEGGSYWGKVCDRLRELERNSKAPTRYGNTEPR
jgi:hypothetical protein